MNTAFFSLIPSFMSGLQALRADMISAALVISFAGLVTHFCLALYAGNTLAVMPTLVRLGIVSMTISLLPSWADLLSTAAYDLAQDFGPAANSAAVFQAFEMAVSNQFGSPKAAAESKSMGTWGQKINVPTTEGDTSSGYQQNTDGTIQTPSLGLALLPDIIKSGQSQLVNVIGLILAWVAGGIMWLMGIVQTVLYMVEIAISGVYRALHDSCADRLGQTFPDGDR
jgi:hypothetical protein